MYKDDTIDKIIKFIFAINPIKSEKYYLIDKFILVEKNIQNTKSTYTTRRDLCLYDEDENKILELKNVYIINYPNEYCISYNPSNSSTDEEHIIFSGNRIIIAKNARSFDANWFKSAKEDNVFINVHNFKQIKTEQDEKFIFGTKGMILTKKILEYGDTMNNKLIQLKSYKLDDTQDILIFSVGKNIPEIKEDNVIYTSKMEHERVGEDLFIIHTSNESYIVTKSLDHIERDYYIMAKRESNRYYTHMNSKVYSKNYVILIKKDKNSHKKSKNKYYISILKDNRYDLVLKNLPIDNLVNVFKTINIKHSDKRLCRFIGKNIYISNTSLTNEASEYLVISNVGIFNYNHDLVYPLEKWQYAIPTKQKSVFYILDISSIEKIVKDRYTGEYSNAGNITFNLQKVDIESGRILDREKFVVGRDYAEVIIDKIKELGKVAYNPSKKNSLRKILLDVIAKSGYGKIFYDDKEESGYGKIFYDNKGNAYQNIPERDILEGITGNSVINEQDFKITNISIDKNEKLANITILPLVDVNDFINNSKYYVENIVEHFKKEGLKNIIISIMQRDENIYILARCCCILYYNADNDKYFVITQPDGRFYIENFSIKNDKLLISFNTYLHDKNKYENIAIPPVDLKNNKFLVLKDGSKSSTSVEFVDLLNIENKNEKLKDLSL